MSVLPMKLDLEGLTITVVDGGSFRLDGALLYGILPRVFWEKLNRPDEDNRVLLGIFPLIVEGPGGTVIIDPGIGHGWSPGATDRYDLIGQRQLYTILDEAGVAPEDVTGIITTHLHFDHVSGAVTGSAELEEDGESLSAMSEALLPDLMPSLPNAKLYVQAAEVESSRQPDLRTASHVASTVSQVYEREGRLVQLDGNSELFPGIEVELTAGHTPGHQVVWLKGKDATALVPGDLIPTSSHLRSEVQEGMDYAPTVSARVKAGLLARAVEVGAYLTFYHAPRVRWGRLRSGPSGIYKLDETKTLSPPPGTITDRTGLHRSRGRHEE